MFAAGSTGGRMIGLDSMETEFGTITVRKKRLTGAISYVQGGYVQSEADCNGVSLASYVHALFGLILQTKARGVLLIGCGGGSLATMLARAGLRVTVADVNPGSFSLAKQYFALPASVDCQVADGKSFLRARSNVYDAVIVDAYHGNQAPAHLESIRFYELVRNRLSDQGVIFANIYCDHIFDRHVDRVADGISTVFPNVRVLDSADVLDRNVIVMAGAVSRLEPPPLLMPPLVDRRTIEAELAALKFRAWQPAR